MFRARFGALLTVAILLATISLPVSTAVADPDGRWTASLGAGLANQFVYRSHAYSWGDYREQFGLSGLLVAGAAYRLSDHVSLRADLGYLGYQKDLDQASATSSAGIVGMWPSGSALTAQMPFASAGVRLYAIGPAAMRPALYLEALPALWVSRWRERMETRGYYDFSGNYHPSRVDQDAFVTLEPGFSASAGFLGPFVGRSKLDLGFRYLFSTGVGRRDLGLSSGEFRGLRQAALVMAVHVPI
jgi:hypothetical protein